MTTAPNFNICVYCGSRPGSNPAFAAAATEVGRLIGTKGWGLVYGGGRGGLMGTVADAALAAGARVTGIIPRSLMEREVGHTGLHELHVVETMHQRKQQMAERAQAFLALPGGIGTMEELFEVWTWRQLGYHNKPIGLLNTAGYYETLMSFMRNGVEQDFLGPNQLAFVENSSEAGALLDRLFRQSQASPASTPGVDYGRI